MLPTFCRSARFDSCCSSRRGVRARAAQRRSASCRCSAAGSTSLPVSGLYAPAGQFLPPAKLGQMERFVALDEQRAGSTVTSPVRPSMLATHVLMDRRRAHRNSPVRTVERVDDAGLARDTGDDLVLLAGLMAGLIHVTASARAQLPYRAECARRGDRDPSDRRCAGSTRRSCRCPRPARACSCDRGISCRSR